MKLLGYFNGMKPKTYFMSEVIILYNKQRLVAISDVKSWMAKSPEAEPMP